MTNVKTFDLIIEFKDHALTFGNLSRIAVARYIEYYRECADFVNCVCNESE